MSDDFNQPPNAPAAAPRRNMVATVAFLAALLGFCIPAVPSFVALVLGIVAMRREPRGFAIGAIALAVLQFVAISMVLLVISLISRSAPAMQSRAMKEARSALDDALAAERRDGVDRFPIGEAAGFDAVDPWGSRYRVEVMRSGAERTVRIWSAGPDGSLDTGDDFVAAAEETAEQAAEARRPDRSRARARRPAAE